MADIFAHAGLPVTAWPVGMEVIDPLLVRMPHSLPLRGIACAGRQAPGRVVVFEDLRIAGPPKSDSEQRHEQRSCS